MTQVRVALVCPDDSLRMAAARAFDDAPSHWSVTLHRTAPDDADALVAIGCSLPDAVAFDPEDPSAVVAEITRRLVTRDRRVVVVIGASGGCGATSVALHLAAEASRRTCVIGTGQSELAVRLGLEISDGAPPVPVRGGFRAASVPLTDLTRAVNGVAEAFEAVIVDAGRFGLDTVGARSHACVMVLSPTVPSARAAAEILSDLEDTPCAVVTNRLGPGGETSSAELQRILGRRICLELPCSRLLRDAEGECRLVSTWSRWRRRVGRLATALELR